MTRLPYTSEPVLTDGTLADVRIHIDGKTWHLWGRKGHEREQGLAEAVPDSTLPVLIGTGLGHALQMFADKGIPVAVIDRETNILETSGVTFPEGILHIDDDDPREALRRIEEWQQAHDNLPLTPIVIPLYLRLDREYYGALAETIKNAPTPDFWSQVRYPKFSTASPKVLFFDSNYFLCKEIRSALNQLDIEHQLLPIGKSATGSQGFIEDLLAAVVDFKPDFVLTVNHFGLDREGKLAGLLDDLGLPLASWFVDNPHLILYDYAHPGTDNTAIFSFDAGNLDEMRTKGFDNVHFLPLATDPTRFRPGLRPAPPTEWRSDVSFVGNSMVDAVGKSLRLAGLPQEMAVTYPDVARSFGKSGETSVRNFLETRHPQWASALHSLPTRENRLALESLLTWEATRQYRLSCVSATLDFEPLIVGDSNWRDLLPPSGWRHLPGLDYYDDLPRFYPCSAINFNCTSKQMIGAVNQRVFDVPACGGFLLTDYRDQMEDLFDLETEAVTYREPDEIPPLIERYLEDPSFRKSVSTQARKRILAHHTYTIRLKQMIATMRDTFA